MKALFTLMTLVMTINSVFSQEGVSVGDKAPEFKAIADNGTTWDLKEHIGNDYIVVYFYPGAMTSGCTRQACAYRDKQKDLEAADVTVVGISGDKIENLKLFKKAENLNFTLLSDDKGEIAKAYGVPLGAGTNFKKVVDGTEYDVSRDVTAKRWTFIIGKDGKVIYKNDAVNADQDTDEVLNFIRNHSAKS